MSNRSIEHRIQRRSVHRSRSTAVSVALIVLILVAAWIGTESVLSAIGRQALVTDPQTAVNAVLHPDATSIGVAEAVAVILAVAGVVLIILAVKRGHQHRTVVPRDRGATIIDAQIVASTAANAARLSAGVPDGHTIASTRGRHTHVRVVPLSGLQVDPDVIRTAVQERLGGIDPRFGRKVSISVEKEGTLV